MESKFDEKRYANRFIKKVEQAKYKIKPSLSKQENGWHKDGMANTFNLSYDNIKDNIMKIDKNLVSVEDFQEHYEKPNIPVLISNDQNDWPSHNKWILQRLKMKYRNQLFRCGEDPTGCSVKLKMKYFIDYMFNNNDDSPMIIRDCNIENNPKKSKLFDDYSVSSYFYEDLFGIIEEDRRPQYRWFQMGPKRSGLGIRIESLGVSSWHALVKGYTRWCLFPPRTPGYLIKPDINNKWKNLNEAITWFSLMYPRIIQPDWPSEYAMIELIQKPGETLFIPSGWWYVNINITTIVSVSQTFCSMFIFPTVWFKTNQEKKKLAKLWLRKLEQFRPDLCGVVDKINRSESFEKYQQSVSTVSYLESEESGEETSDSSRSSPSSSVGSRTQSIQESEELDDEEEEEEEEDDEEDADTEDEEDIEEPISFKTNDSETQEIVKVESHHSPIAGRSSDIPNEISGDK